MATPRTPPSALFIDWTLLGVDDAGAPVHEPMIITDDVITCRCRESDCQLDSALFRARVAGFVQALQVIQDGRTVRDVLEGAG